MRRARQRGRCSKAVCPSPETGSVARRGQELHETLTNVSPGRATVAPPTPVMRNASTHPPHRGAPPLRPRGRRGGRRAPRQPAGRRQRRPCARRSRSISSGRAGAAAGRSSCARAATRGAWTTWTALAARRGRAARARASRSPSPSGRARGRIVQLRALASRCTALRAIFVNGEPRSGRARRSTPASADDARPSIHTRAEWGADESLRRANPLYATVRAHGVRAPHGHDERLHREPGAVDPALDLRLPRAGERLERHWLQLPRRSLRPDLGGPLRRHHPQRDRGADARLQHGQRRHRLHRRRPEHAR